MSLSPDQEHATEVFKKFLLEPTHKRMVISGAPGRGKTHLTKHLRNEAFAISSMLKLLTVNSNEMTIHNTATTNKAAEVASKAIGVSTQTIHSLIGVRPVFDFGSGKQRLLKCSDYSVIPNSLVMIDEGSGICNPLDNMISQTTSECKTLIIGDKDQLSAVGSNYCSVFSEPELMVELTTSHRYGDKTRIDELNEQMIKTIATGKFEPIIPDNKTVFNIDGAMMESIVRKHYTKELINTDHIKIICWSNQEVNYYNKCIRGLFTDSPSLEVGETVVSNSPVVHDKECILYTEQVCVVTNISSSTYINRGIEGWDVELNNGVTVFQPCEMYKVKLRLKQLHESKEYTDYLYIKDSFADLRPLHASTAHKAQGSTYDIAIVDLADIGRCHDWMQVARMINVAVTRAKCKVFIYGKLPKKYQDQQHKLPKPDEVINEQTNSNERIPF